MHIFHRVINIHLSFLAVSNRLISIIILDPANSKLPF